jgi:hypothetical protein
MIVQLEYSEEAKRRIAADAQLAELLPRACSAGLMSAATVGAAEISQSLQQGKLGLVPRRGGRGLVGSVDGWADASDPYLAWLGVPANSPAAAYAKILQRGGTITPKNAKALAVPISAEAKRHTSPRDMADLFMLSRPGKPPLLVRSLKRRGVEKGLEVHWVLLSSVTLRAYYWLTRGMEDARWAMFDAFRSRFFEIFGNGPGEAA